MSTITVMRFKDLDSMVKLSRDLRKIQYRIRFRRLFKFALRMKLYSVTLSSQLMINLYTMTLLIHQSTLWTCQWLSGKDLKKSFKMVTQS